MSSGKAAFPIKKYSWSKDNSGNGKGNYNHLTADNIFLVLEGEQDARGRLRLQIVQGTSVLDDVDLGKHIDIAISTRETFQRVGRQVADKQLPTYGVASGTKLAITHRPEDGQIRRIQVAMVSQNDCTNIVNHLRFRGMIFVDAVQRNSRRPGSTGSDLRSVNTNISSLLPDELSRTRSPAATRSYSSGREQAPHQTTKDSGTASAYIPTYAYTPSFLAQRSADSFLFRDEDAALRVPHLDHPTASQVFPRVTALTQPTAGLKSDSSAAPHLDSSSKSMSSLFGTTARDNAGHCRADGQTFPSLFSSHVMSTPSPSTSLWPPARSLEDLLPPKRELPFDQARQERSRSSSVLSLTAPAKPPLGYLGSVRSTSSKAEASIARKRPRSAHAAGSKIATSSSDIMTRSKRKHFELEVEAEKERRHMDSMPPPQLLPSSEGSRSSPKDMHELLYEKRPRIRNDGHGRDVEQEHDHTRSQQSKTDSLAQLTSLVNKVVNSSESVGLDKYVILTPTERSRALDKFMLDMLGNKDFATLCEDMSQCWSRLALGL